MHTDKKEIIKFDLVLPSANFPLDVCIILERNIFLRLVTTSSELYRVNTVQLTSMKRCTHLATFFASFARVIGPGGLRKSFVGICLLHCR
jgi:hypothetical protein